MDKQLVIAVAAQIRDYLSRRPHASDTAEGIHQWWICWDTTPEAISVTIAALEHLESKDLIAQWKSGNRMIWRRSVTRQSNGPALPDRMKTMGEI
ncbi:hypothetical protein RBA41_01980 [Massilia sp. CCM 9210]|uniref:hypothetical protein n=1 Tax=Massilia scottii TaxID=3057166 RepID=UPI0027968F4C|nr:hypothetical protein [Massilia sp. CCM 9210]MDQ1812062.1 hypothetical protein [Massilia sp. CCM 9210]